MRRPNLVFGTVPRAVTLISILALAGCGGGGGGNQDGGSGGHTGTGGGSGTGGHVGTGGNGSGGTGGSATDSGTDLPKADAGTGGMTGAGGGTAGMSGAGGQMDSGMDTPNGTGGAGMGGADASVDVPADTAGTGGAMDAGADAAGGADGGVDAGPLATGVEMVSVPLAATGQGQRYNVQNRANPEAPYNLSGQTLTIRAYAPGAIGGDMSVFFRTPLLVDGAATGSVDSAPVKVALSTITGGFTNAQITVPAAAGSFDPSLVDVIRIEIEADATFGATFQTPATIVYFDSITSGNSAVNLTFDVAAGGNDFASSGARPLAGSMGPTFQATYP